MSKFTVPTKTTPQSEMPLQTGSVKERRMTDSVEEERKRSDIDAVIKYVLDRNKVIEDMIRREFDTVDKWEENRATVERLYIISMGIRKAVNQLYSEQDKLMIIGVIFRLMSTYECLAGTLGRGESADIDELLSLGVHVSGYL